MVKQMTREEMIERLNNGEPPEAVALMKWIRLRKWAMEQNLYFDIRFDMHIGARTCALCYAHRESPDCSHCPILKVDFCCQDPRATWQKVSQMKNSVYDQCDMNKLIKYIDEMIVVLEKCNCMEYQKKKITKNKLIIKSLIKKMICGCEN